MIDLALALSLVISQPVQVNAMQSQDVSITPATTAQPGPIGNSGQPAK